MAAQTNSICWHMHSVGISRVVSKAFSRAPTTAYGGYCAVWHHVNGMPRKQRDALVDACGRPPHRPEMPPSAATIKARTSHSCCNTICISLGDTQYVPGLLKFRAAICTFDYRKRATAFLANDKEKCHTKHIISYDYYEMKSAGKQTQNDKCAS